MEDLFNALSEIVRPCSINTENWIICINSYEVDGIEIPRGRMEQNFARPPLSKNWRRATPEEVKSMKWHKGHYYNLNV